MIELPTTVFEGQERYITPVDETGLPYCFAPTVPLPDPRTPWSENQKGQENRLADLNHMYPKGEVATSASPALQSDIAKAALTGARVQWVNFSQHHDVYNNLFVGPSHPQSDEELFTALAMASAGYIPEYALDLSKSGPRIVGLTKKQRRWLWTEGHVNTHCPSDVSRFLFEYVMRSDMSHLRQEDIEDFLYTYDYEKRVQLGRALVRQVVERVAEPLEAPYREARRQQVLTFVRVGAFKAQAPDNAPDLVKAKLIVSNRVNGLYAAFSRRLAQEPRRPFREYEAAQAA